MRKYQKYRVRRAMRYSILCVAVVICCTQKPSLVKKTFFRIDTLNEITLVLAKKHAAEPIWDAIDSLLLDWEERFSVTGTKSEVAKLNNRMSAVMPLSAQMATLIDYALRYGDSLDGGFDLTILPIKEVWGFGEGAFDTLPLPDSITIRKALEKVSYKNISLNSNRDSIVFSSPQTRIDVGGIAKGCVLAELASLLDFFNIRNYLVVAGGDIVCRGEKPNGKQWLIGIQDPRNSSAYIATLPIESGTSVVTSGDYERFKFVDGKRYHHLFDSHTGMCCNKNQSVTVYGPDPIIVDILSTGLFCRPAEAIVTYIDERPAYQCLVIDSSGNCITSSNWSGQLQHGLK